MTWYYKKKEVNEIAEDYIGFVYLITNVISGRKYIGKKLAKFAKTTYKTVILKNGKKKKKKIRGKIESDWKDYYGSSDALTLDIQSLGKENFTREILFYCKNKAECSYIELREQILKKVLESDDYYNGHVQARIHKRHINGKLNK